MTKTITTKEAWRIYNDPSTPSETSTYEVRADGSYGLLLGGCPTCGKFQTRESYLSGKETSFFVDTVELVTSYSCIGIAKCRCGQWVKWCH